jgi:recombination protein RecT
MANNIQKKENKVTFSMKMNGDAFQRTIMNTLQDPKRAARFTASITSAVANQPELQECDAGTVLSSALLGESLNLSPSLQLGQFYMVPFKDHKRGRTVATFVLGYKGYIQLALRSGYYSKLNVLEIKEGELKKYDPLEETIEVEIIQDAIAREAAKTIGYYVFFEYQNGFKKMLYWSREKMEAHALHYSPAYAGDKKNGTDYSFWAKDFDAMAKKTMIRQLISKWGIMSIELRDAIEKDGAVLNEGQLPEYLSDEEEVISETAAKADSVDFETEKSESEVDLDEL